MNQAFCHAGDISGLKDSFNFFYTRISDHDGLEVRIDHIKNTSVWSKAGLMLRESLEPDAKYLFLFATPSINGVVIQSRDSKGNGTKCELVSNINPPIWLKVKRRGEKINLYCGKDKEKWSFTRTVPFNFTSESYMGLALCSPEHDAFLNWYSSNYIQLYSYKDFSKHQMPFDFNVGLHKDRNFFSFCPYLRTQFMWYPSIERLEKNNIDIIELMIGFLDDRNYVDVELDEFFVPDRTAFKQYNRLHTNLLYGYDRTDETFDIAGYADGDVFRKSKLTFTDFRNAFFRDKDSNVILLQIHDYYNYKLNSHMLKMQLEAHLNSTDFFSSLSANRNYEPEIVYGLDAYDCFIENFPSHQSDIRPLHVIYEHKKLMLMRLIHMQLIGVLDDKIFEILYEGYKELERLSLACRNAQLKNKISKSDKNVDNILNHIHTIKIQESKLIPLLLNNL